MDKYEFAPLEAKWRERWAQWNLDRTAPAPKRKFYVLEMFAYPSGDIHMGHFRNYSIGDVAARYQMMCGYDVLHPFGWDAFGLPAEGAAIKNKTHPRAWTIRNIETGNATLKQMALSYDWEREVRTCEPDYYRWTQWLFLLLFKKGLAYRGASVVNWCETCKTILANENCQGGKCWRCERDVVKKPIENCWFFKYSSMSERLLADLDKLPGWPEETKTKQRNWIGKSVGCEIDFVLDGKPLSVFTTRPDTVYGVTFLVVAPEHPLASEGATPEVAAYIKRAAQKSERDRMAEGDKDGVFTGRSVVNPLNGRKVPLWVADYVVAGYGTGVVMGVPAHDTRDYAFAKKYGLPVKIVISGGPERYEDAYVGPGTMIDSGELTGTPSPQGIPRVIEYVERNKQGRAKVNYKLKDWLISRQRYWGCPIPVIHCRACGPQAVPDQDLPVLLPAGEIDLMPKGRSPLADRPEFMKVACPKCGAAAERDPDTMDTFMCSSYYLYRYLDPKNAREPWSRQEAKTWLPVDLYIGGDEHACMHLLYFRFIAKVLFDEGWVPTDEPVVRLFHQGMVADEHGDTMSKSKGNAISPRDLFAEWGVDVSRLAMFFFAPSEDQIRWSTNGLVGAMRFVHRFWKRIGEAMEAPGTATDAALMGKLHRTIRRVTEAYEKDLHFNTAMSSIMEFLNAWEPVAEDRKIAGILVPLMAPMAPFLGEELWEKLGHTTSVFKSGWPGYDAALAREEQVTIVVQINGKKRAEFGCPRGTPSAELEKRGREAAAAHLGGQSPVKVIVVPDRIVNLVVRS